MSGALLRAQLGSARAGTGSRRPPRANRATCLSAATVEAPTKLSAADRVVLGDSDLNVSVCCLGTMTWGQQNTEAEAHEQLSYSWDQGINFIDTAEMYPIPTKAETQGLTDKYIGTWMKGRTREDIILASKVCGYSDRTAWVRHGKWAVARVTREQIAYSVEQSLQRLQTDYIDLLQIHWPDRYVPLFGQGSYDPAQVREAVPFEEQLRGMEDVIKAGKVRYIGVSNETPYGVGEFVAAAHSAGLPKIVSIQNVYHLLNRVQYETNLAEACNAYNVGLLAYSPLAGGALSGKYLKGPQQGARLSLFPGYMERYLKSRAQQAVARYAELAAKYGLTATQLALAWCRSRWFVTSTIIGATTMEQLKEDLDAFSIQLPQECTDEVQAVFQEYKDPSMIS